ncbi:hypothetical protein KSB_68040 [Ktedonobacter robiniae]|uniref:Transposase putative helix-turn-helix domain-containing protein n=1 Tax=Ktedonobacter robiniae TaxID=2778365 RepID=A0ABQ3V096_9CHLR|nr:hypothetical protein KSB_68040 [Ktedonobacter robiniae]
MAPQKESKHIVLHICFSSIAQPYKQTKKSFQQFSKREENVGKAWQDAHKVPSHRQMQKNVLCIEAMRGFDIYQERWAMIRAHKIRLHPTEEQKGYFVKAAGVARFTWN